VTSGILRRRSHWDALAHDAEENGVPEGLRFAVLARAHF
jgi:hypothetical protein